MKKTVILRTQARRKSQNPSQKKTRVAIRRERTLISLFCGPGGFDAGFRQAGFTSLLAIDAESAACRTFERNYPETSVYRADLSALKRGFIADRLLKTMREAGYFQKLLMAQQLMQRWNQGPRRERWKPWVATKSKCMITEKWLTRMVNLGKLIPPADR